MIVYFGVLSFFKKEELTFGKKITVVVGTVVDSDGFGSGVIGDCKHNLTTMETFWFGYCREVFFGKNRVDVPGCFD